MVVEFDADGLLLLRIQRLFFLRAAQGQQGNDVGLGERGLGTKGRRELADVAVQTDGHIVFLHPGGGIDVDDGLDHDRIGEEDFAVLQTVGGPGKVGGAIGDVDAAENGRLGDGSADAQIDAAGQLRVGILKVELRRGEDVNIQPHMAGGRGGIRRHASRRSWRQSWRSPHSGR